jgi:hypothetical protein
MQQMILLVETKERRIGAAGTAYENINFPANTDCVFPASPKEALKRGWRLLSPPVYNSVEEVWEWWFEKIEIVWNNDNVPLIGDRIAIGRTI